MLIKYYTPEYLRDNYEFSHPEDEVDLFWKKYIKLIEELESKFKDDTSR
jgi:hypothetical protein